MNLLVTFYCGAFFVVCFLADDAVSSSDENILLALPHEVCRSRESMFVRVTGLGRICDEMADPEPTQTQRNETIEEYRNEMSNFCQGQSLIRNCLAETTTKITTCQDEPFLKVFKIYREVMEQILDIGCSDNGDKLAIMVHGIIHISKLNFPAKKCFDRYLQMFRDLDISNMDISSKLFNVYKEMKTLKECINQQQLLDSFKDIVKFFMEPVITTIKCVNPLDGELVLCSTIDPSSIATPNVCDARTIGTDMSLYDIMEQDSVACDWEFLGYSESVLDEAEIQEHLNRICRDSFEGLPYCYKQSMIVYELCLNATEQNYFNLLGDFIRSAYRTICSDGDKKRLVKILTEVYRRKTAEQPVFMWECMEMAQSPGNAMDEHHGSASKNMRLYHEMEAFKGCLVNKLQGHQTSIDAATSLINELLKKVKCVHPEDGSTVLCETLHHTA